MSTTQNSPRWQPRRIVIDPETGVRYWDMSDCPEERLSPGCTPDHPSRSGGMSVPDYRLYRARQSSATAGQHRRAPRAASTRSRGSRRTSSSSRSSGTDPGDGDGDPDSARACEGCGQPLIGKAPQARFHGDACRMRAARRKAAKPPRPVWPETEIVAAATSIEPTGTLAALMADPPHGILTMAVAA